MSFSSAYIQPTLLNRKGGAHRKINYNTNTNARNTRTYSTHKFIVVKLSPPLGLILASEQDKGAYVEEIVTGGAADKDGNIEVGDAFSKIETQGKMINCEEMHFDQLMSLLANKQEIRIELKRLESEIDNSANAAEVAYWERKRNERTSGKKMLRRTVGVVPDDIRVSKNGPLNQGNFGLVFLGTWKGEKVILKTSQKNVLWADDLLDAELEINEFVHRNAKGTCASFLGCCEIDSRSEGQIYNGTLSAGLWLMWRFQGLQTLGSLYADDQTLFTGLSRTVCLSPSAEKIDIVKDFIRNLTSKLAKLHSIGIVHRDIKPENILLTDDGPIFIDLGASASCLKTSINYFSGAGPADPLFSAQCENYLIPEGAPVPLEGNMSLLWDKYTPDRFDVFSVGIIVLQLLSKALRDKENLKVFLLELERCKLDLSACREACQCTSDELALLSADRNAGWELVDSLLCPREMRMSVVDVVAHRFLN